MLTLLLLVLLLLGGAVAVRRAGSTSLGHAFGIAVRHVRVLADAYRLEDVMQAMSDEMLASVLPSLARRYVPNSMTFGLHSADADRWSGYFPQLADELRDLMLAKIAASPDLYLSEAGLTVHIGRDDAGAPGRPSFTARMIAGGAPARDGETVRRAELTPSVVEGSATRALWSLVLAGEPAVELTSELLIGRTPPADAIVEDERVSRRHARFSPVGHGVVVEDLDSANGTFVNGRRITESVVLDAGDIVRFGPSAVATISCRV